MSAIAAERTSRQSRQHLVEALLRELDERRRELYRLRARGVQRAGMRDVKRNLLEVRRHLGDVVAGRVDPAAGGNSGTPVISSDRT
jgi:hypothetical protein